MINLEIYRLSLLEILKKHHITDLEILHNLCNISIVHKRGKLITVFDEIPEYSGLEVVKIITNELVIHLNNLN